MTAKRIERKHERRLLEEIAETVQAIDRIVEEIRDRLSDYLDELSWESHSWFDDGTGPNTGENGGA